MTNLTQHAQTRQQQRGIPTLALEMLTQYGACEYDHRGVRKLFFDKKARKCVAKVMGPEGSKWIEAYQNVFVIVCCRTGAIITTGYIH